MRGELVDVVAIDQVADATDLEARVQLEVPLSAVQVITDPQAAEADRASFSFGVGLVLPILHE